MKLKTLKGVKFKPYTDWLKVLSDNNINIINIILYY